LIVWSGRCLNVPNAVSRRRFISGSVTGDFTDQFGHPMTVLAVTNGKVRPPQDDVKQLMDDKAAGR
jgi:hypothetical protein